MSTTTVYYDGLPIDVVPSPGFAECGPCDDGLHNVFLDGNLILENVKGEENAIRQVISLIAEAKRLSKNGGRHDEFEPI